MSVPAGWLDHDPAPDSAGWRERSRIQDHAYRLGWADAMAEVNRTPAASRDRLPGWVRRAVLVVAIWWARVPLTVALLVLALAVGAGMIAAPAIGATIIYAGLAALAYRWRRRHHGGPFNLTLCWALFAIAGVIVIHP